jgi:hypothetical protein
MKNGNICAISLYFTLNAENNVPMLAVAMNPQKIATGNNNSVILGIN